MKKMQNGDYYEILCVPRDATEEEIKSSYRRLIKRYHPDINPASPDAEKKLQEVMVAYQTLGDRRKKADYDRMITLFGPLKAESSEVHIPPAHRSSGLHQSPIVTGRRKRSSGISVGSLIIVVVFVILLFQWQNIYARLFGIWPITPIISVETMDRSAGDPALPFTASFIPEDQWYIRFRMQDYQLMRGGMGSARGLAEAYMDAAGNAFHERRDQDAALYIRLAVIVDPAYTKSQWLYRRLRDER